MDVQVLVIGEGAPSTEGAEFAAALDVLHAAATLHSAADPVAARQALAGGLRPELIVLLQQRPGEFRERDVDDLRRRAPLAIFVALQGSWCEAEGRIGQPIPGVVRLAWRNAADELAAGLDQLRRDQVPDWAGPATLTAEERLLRRMRNELPRCSGRVGIMSSSHEMRRLLLDICRGSGWSAELAHGSTLEAMPPPSAEGAGRGEVILWDLDELPKDFGDIVAAWRTAGGKSALIILLAFPRAHDLRAALAAGAAVIAKPFSVEEMLKALRIAAVQGGAISPREPAAVHNSA